MITILFHDTRDLVSRYPHLGTGLYYAQNFTYYAFEHCSQIKPIMLKIMPSKSRLCSRTDCFIRVYQPFLTAVLE